MRRRRKGDHGEQRNGDHDVGQRVIVGAGNPTSVFTSAGSGFNNRLINAFGGISEDRLSAARGAIRDGHIDLGELRSCRW